MKTKKILAIVVSCLLLIGVAAGITASAADAPTVAVSEVNLSYEGAIRLLYTFDTENLAAGQTVKAVFSANADTKVADGKFDASAYDYVGTAFNMDGETAVYSGGISPTVMTAPIYVIPVVTDSADNVVAVGEKVCFSIYDYCMARLGGEYTPEQYLLYLATLNFGGSIQKGQTALGAEKPANGYADEYYILSVMSGDGSVTEYKFEEPTEYQLVAPRSSNGKLFDSFVDNKGVKYENADFNKLVVSLDKPGYIYVKAVYGNEDAVSATIPAGYSDTLPNLDATPATVKGGSDYYVESGVTLSAGASATLAFNPDVATVTLTENSGKITVTDGVSSFEMANGASLRIEYTVINTTKKTGALFYYVDGAYVAHSNVTSTANATFTGVTAAAAAGDFAVDGVILGYKAGNATFSPGTDATVTAEHDGTNKYFVYNKATYNKATAGTVKYYIAGDAAANKTVFETKVKLNDWFSNDWRKHINLSWTQWDGSKTHIMGKMRIRFESANTLVILDPSVATNIKETITLPTAIANNEWFNLRIETLSGQGAYVKIYFNDELVYTKTSFSPSSYSEYSSVAVREFNIAPADTSSGSISFCDTKFYAVK